jgi:DNA-binding beta-propeller fold protein YncE
MTYTSCAFELRSSPMHPPSLPTTTALVAACLTFVSAALAGEDGSSFIGNRLVVSAVGGDSLLEYSASVFSRTIGDASLAAPRGVAFGPDGKLYVAAGNSIFRFAGDGALESTIGAGAGLVNARGIAFGPNGNLFVTAQDRVLEISPSGDLERTIGAGAGLGVPVALCFGADDHLFVAAAGSNEVVEFDATGARVGALSIPALAIPMGIAYSGDGTLYVSSFFGNSIAVIDANGEQRATFTDPTLLFPAGLAIGPDGHLYVASFFSAQVIVFDREGVKQATLQLPVGTSNPEGIAFAPFRFAIELEGRLTRHGGKSNIVHDTGILAFAPGSATAQITLDDGDLTSTFLTSSWVFHGFESAKSPAAATRLVQGAEISTLGPGIGQASLSLTMKGKSQSFGASDAFRPKSATGTLQRGGPQGVFRGTIVTTGPAE